MRLPNEDDIRPILQDFETRIRTILEDAWDEWMEIPARGRFSPRSRASMVFDFIKTRAHDEFDGDPNIHPIPKGQTVHFLFRDQVLVRFKKANNLGLGSNVETQAVLEFIDPEQAIPGLLPDIFPIEVCYHLDELATRIDQIAVTAREKYKRRWSYEIAKHPSGDVMPFPAPSGPDIPPPEIRVRKPKIDDSKADE